MSEMIRSLHSIARPRFAGIFNSRCVLLVVFIAGTAVAQTGISSNAPSIEFYVGLDESCCGEDPHPVHGIATPDGGQIVVGKSIAANGNWGGFAVKVSPSEALGVGTFLDPGNSAVVNWTVQLQEDRGKATFLNAASTESAVFLAGLRASGRDRIDMYLAKHDLTTGSLIWEKKLISPGGSGAIEAIQLTADGGLVGVGISNAPLEGLEGFKSFGNPMGGQAHIFYLSSTQVASNNPPSEPTWSQTYSQYETAKAVRHIPNGERGFIVLAGSEEAPAALIRTNERGEKRWSRSYPERFEATDVALHYQGENHLGFTFTGHGGQDDTLDGQLTRVDLNGDLVWAKSFGNPSGGVGVFAGLDSGDPRLIYDECWGVQGLADGGTIVGCGTGIEGCDLVRDETLRRQCAADARTTWRGFVVRFDSNGEIVWQRVDSFIETNVDGEVADAASEYIALLPDGGFLSVVDQGFGIGLLKLVGDNTASEGSLTSTPQSDVNDESNDEEVMRPQGDEESADTDDESWNEGEDEDTTDESEEDNPSQADTHDEDSAENEDTLTWDGGGCSTSLQGSHIPMLWLGLCLMMLVRPRHQRER